MAFALIDKPVLPFGTFTFHRHRRVERMITASHAAVHADNLIFGDVELLSDMCDLFRAHVTIIDGLDLPLDAAQVEKQLLLCGGGADFDERPRPQDIFLNACLDPPHGIGGQPEALFQVQIS